MSIITVWLTSPAFVSSLPSRIARHKFPPLSLLPRRPFRQVVAPLLALGTADSDDSSDGPPLDDDAPLLERLSSYPAESDQQSESSDSNTPSTSSGQLFAFAHYLRSELALDVENFLSPTTRYVTIVGLAVLFGFFAATSASTIIGSVADWDPLAAAVLLVWTEWYTRYYYTRKRKTRLLRVINAFKIGLIFGMTIDAFKLSA